MKKFLQLLHPKIESAPKSGFLLLELIFTIAILLVITAISVQFFSISDAALVRCEIEKLYSTIICMQSQAQVERIEKKLIINQKDNSYSINGEKIQKLNSNVLFGYIHNTYGPPGKPTKLIAQAVSFKNSAIIAHPDGILSSGIIYLTDKQRKYMYALTISVAQISHLRLYKYKDNKWEIVK